MKEGRQKRYRDMIKQYSQNWTFKSNKKDSTSKSEGNASIHTNKRIKRKQSKFGATYGNGETIREKPNR